MKKLLLTIALGLSFMFANAQTQSGFTVITSARTNNVVVSPTKVLLETEAGFIFKHIGFTVFGISNYKLETSKYGAYGAKLYVPIATVSNLRFNAAVEAMHLQNAPRANRDHAFTYELSVSAPLLPGVDARITGLGWHHEEAVKHSNTWDVCPGAEFSLVFRPFGKK